MKLSEAQLFDQIKLLKPSSNRLPTVEVILDYVSKELNLPANEELFDIIKLQLQNYKRKASQLQKQKGSERSSLGDPAKIVIDTAVIDDTVFNETPEPERKKRRKKHFDDLKKRQLLKRTQAIWDEIQICKFAEQEEVSEWRILGLLLTRCDDMDASKVGQSLWDGSFKENKNEDFISVDTAVTLMADSSLGRQSYTNQRKLLKNSDKDILPPWKHLRSHQEQITPGMHLLPQPHIGVYFSFSDAMKMTTQRLISNQAMNLSDGEFILNIKFGFDCSGSHAIYNQLNNIQTNNIIIAMFCPLSLVSSDGFLKVWEQPSPNNPLTHRPLQLIMGKESTQSLKTLEHFNEDISSLKRDDFDIIDNQGSPSTIKINILSHMMDMKAAHLYLGLGGA